jgi:hypothetical protein
MLTNGEEGATPGTFFSSLSVFTIDLIRSNMTLPCKGLATNNRIAE